MAYQYKRYKKNKASIIPIEETYTDLDVNNNDENTPSVGYRFDSPRRWATAASVNKSIGIRDLKLTPSSGDIRCKFLMFGDTSITGRKYTWTETNPNDDDDDDWIPCYLNDITPPAMHKFPYGWFQCVSSDFNVQITPENNFEEIITEILNFVNDASWKSIVHTNDTHEYIFRAPKEHDDSKSLYYVKEEVDNNNDTEYSTYSYIYNINYLKLPVTCYYEFDSNTCDFNVKPHNDLRRILMLNRSKSNNDLTMRVATVSEFDDGLNNAYHYVLRRGFDHTTQLTHTVNGSSVNYDNVYLGNGIIRLNGFELLLIVKLEDKNSIKAVYDLFNQPMPNDLSILPTVNLDDGLYVIPFKDYRTFKSHFCYGIGTTKANYLELYNLPMDDSFNDAFTETNLKLNNVWDRLHLIYHASFAETKHRIIGRNGDHWDTPNKQFMVPPGDQDQFYIRFTTDGTHSILPIGCHFNVDLCFIHNPTNNTATGTNHDHFKD